MKYEIGERVLVKQLFNDDLYSWLLASVFAVDTSTELIWYSIRYTTEDGVEQTGYRTDTNLRKILITKDIDAMVAM